MLPDNTKVLLKLSFQMLNFDCELPVILTDRYLEGLTSILEVLDAQLYWQRAYKDMLDAQAYYKRALAFYKNSIGQI